MPDLMRFLRRDRALRPPDARKRACTQDDRALAQRLHYLFHHTLSEPSASGFHVYVKQGIVTLSGPIFQEADRTRLVSLIERVPGVEGIQDQLHLALPITSEPPPSAALPEDALEPLIAEVLEEALEAALQHAPAEPAAVVEENLAVPPVPALAAPDSPLPATASAPLATPVPAEARPAPRRPDKPSKPRSTAKERAKGGRKQRAAALAPVPAPAEHPCPEPVTPLQTAPAAAAWEHLAVLLAEPTLATLASDPILQAELADLATEISAEELESLLNAWSSDADTTAATDLLA
jgi:hypothetical protein